MVIIVIIDKIFMDQKVKKSAEILIHHPTDKLGHYAVNGGPGRPKGLKNKFSQIKDDILEIWEQEDGKERLRELIQNANKNDFIKIFGLIVSLLPKDAVEVPKGQFIPQIKIYTPDGKLLDRPGAQTKIQSNGT